MLPSETITAQKVCLNELEAVKESGWDAIKATLTALSRKRGLAKTVVTALVEKAYEWTLEEKFLEDEALVVDVLEYLCELTEGKIFVEVIRARVISRLSDYKEAAGDLPGAKALMQDLQVEAFTTMDTVEKTDFILKQMRLILFSKDYIRVEMASKKLSKKTLNLPELENQKISYYEYLLMYHVHEKNYLQAANCYAEMMDTECTKSEPLKLCAAYVSQGLCTILERTSDDRTSRLQDLVKQYGSTKSLQGSPECDVIKTLMMRLLDQELTSWPIDEKNMDLLKQNIVLQEEPFAGAEERMNLLTKRVLQKNITVIAKTHSMIYISELAELVNSNNDVVEEVLVAMISKSTVIAKIDRPGSFIAFGDPKVATPIAATDTAGDKINQALSLLGNLVHSIDREYMVHEQRQQTINN